MIGVSPGLNDVTTYPGSTNARFIKSTVGPTFKKLFGRAKGIETRAKLLVDQTHRHTDAWHELTTYASVLIQRIVDALCSYGKHARCLHTHRTDTHNTLSSTGRLIASEPTDHKRQGAQVKVNCLA